MGHQRLPVSPLFDEYEAKPILAVDMNCMGNEPGLSSRSVDMLEADPENFIKCFWFGARTASYHDHVSLP
jgi:hypothetical protein